MGGDRTGVHVAQGLGVVGVRVGQDTHGRDVELAFAAVCRSGSC